MPSILEAKKEEIDNQELRVNALRELQPEWARLKNLQSSVISETAGRQQELEAQASAESASAAALHEEVQGLKARSEVSRASSTQLLWFCQLLDSSLNAMECQGETAGLLPCRSHT